MGFNRLLAGGLALSGLLASATAPLATEDDCAGVLEAFNSRLAEQRIPQNDRRALEAWEKARPHCEAGNPAEAVEVLNEMLAEAGVPPIPASSAENPEGQSGG
jgi:pentatricopeptide repeat protein